MINEKIFDKDYIMGEIPSFEGLKKLGVEPLVLERLYNSRIMNHQVNKLEISDIQDIDDINLLTDLFVGTTLNKCYDKEEVENSIFELQLSDELIPYSFLFNIHQPILKWNDCYFDASINKYNQMILYPLENVDISEKTLCFELTTK